MKLIKPYYEIRTPIDGEEILKNIELAARTCYKSEGKIEYSDTYFSTTYGDREINGYAKSARELIPKLLNKNHETMLEFGGMINVLFVCDRGVSHELVRHRVASFAQESTRYCNYSTDKFDSGITFIIPEWLQKYSLDPNPPHDYLIWIDTMSDAEIAYANLIHQGWTPQQARCILPNSLKTEINLSANIREWRHIFKLRCSPAAHPQMRELMIPLLKEFQSKIPILFDNII